MPRGSSDRGEAVTEFIVLVVAVMLPITSLVVATMTVQAAMTASAHAVREAGRAFMLAASVPDGMRQAQAAASIALSDQGFVLPAGGLSVSCDRCLEPGSEASITVDWRVPLPFVPLGDDVGVPIHATHTVRIDDWR